MKIGIVSDLHAEFWHPAHFKSVGAMVQRQLAEADLVLLAGDIDSDANSVRTALRLFPSRPVCLVAGNHEFYGRTHNTVLDNLRLEAADTQVAFLHRDCFIATIKGQRVRVLGVTLWTDFALFGTPDLSLFHAKQGLNDFRLIRHDDGHLLTPADTLLWHQTDLQWLLEELEKPFDGITIVLTHHAPVNFAISPNYINDAYSPCFASKLEHVLARDNIALVVWGHTHHCIDQMIGTTRFISNQTGYVTGDKLVETANYGVVIEI